MPACLCLPTFQLSGRQRSPLTLTCLPWLNPSTPVFVPISFSAPKRCMCGGFWVHQAWISLTPESLLIHIPLQYSNSQNCCRLGRLRGRARGLSKHSENLEGSGKELKEKYLKQIFIKFDSIRKPSHGWVQSPVPSHCYVASGKPLNFLLLILSLIKVEECYLSFYLYLIIVRLFGYCM